MARTMTVAEMSAYILTIKSKNESAMAHALVDTMQQAHKFARQNYKENFKGRGGRVLSGRLANHIYVGYENKTPLNAELGVNKIPYAAIHEFGGEIEPVNAKYLWIKTYDAWKSGQFKRLTPSEFYKRAKKKKSKYFYKTNGKKGMAAFTKPDGEVLPLFWLTSKVTIPERPYLTPAIEKAAPLFSGKYTNWFSRLSKGE